ncbi:hypothetical protein [Photorhabdus kleinii]|nr:hypothetical protein [Photorhabdus kleinii]
MTLMKEEIIKVKGKLLHEVDNKGYYYNYDHIRLLFYENQVYP